MLKKIIYSILSVVILLIIGCDNITDPDSVQDPTIPINYDLVWEDNFDQSTLDDTYWGYDIGYGNNGWGNDEWQNYTNSAENIRVEDGNMIISAIWDSVNYDEPGERDGSVTSARVNTKNKFSFKFGKIQARIKVPTDIGMWPAFWMLGDSFDTSGWPSCGEIDVMEVSPLQNGNSTTMCTMHWLDDNTNNHTYDGGTYDLNEDLSNDYHVYEVEWDEHRLVGKIDGITYFVKVIDSNTMSEFFQNFFLIFNVAVGGTLGGEPNETTVWPQEMMVDWVRVYQNEEDLIPIESFGIYTEETQVDYNLTIGVDSEIFVWVDEWNGSLTLVPGPEVTPYEGEEVISWASNGIGWFGGGIQSNLPLDFTDFAEGNLKFMIKMPGDVTFKIGIMDSDENQNYVEFPANQTTYGLVRDGEWGQAVIPVADLSGSVNLQLLTHEFIILEENGANCEFALDDIYYDGGGVTAGSVSFDADTYTVDDTMAEITVMDQGASGTTVSASVENGTDTISIDLDLDVSGMGTGTLNFGPTNDDTDTIEITAGGSISVSYTDSGGIERTDSANISGGAVSAAGIYSESHTTTMIPYTQIINSADWSGNSAVPDEMSTAVTPVDGTYVLSITYETGGAGWGGIAFDFGSADISSYSTLKFSIDTTNMPTLAHLGIKLEDNTTGNTEVDLFTYTPVVSGNWAAYEIPLSDFPGANLADLKYLGIWNPQDDGNVLLFDTIYFDDIYLD